MFTGDPNVGSRIILKAISIFFPVLYGDSGPSTDNQLGRGRLIKASPSVGVNFQYPPQSTSSSRLKFKRGLLLGEYPSDFEDRRVCVSVKTYILYNNSLNNKILRLPLQKIKSRYSRNK